MSVFKGAFLLSFGLFLSVGLSFSQSYAETPFTYFQFDRFNQTYENIAPKIKEVQSGPLMIRLSSPEHRLTLHSHGLEMRPSGDKMHHAALSVEIEGTGRLLMEIDLLGLRQVIEDRFQIPRQKKEVVGEIRVDREGAGYRITPIKIPKTVSVNIQSDLGLQLVLWCNSLPFPLMDCKDLDRVLSQLTLPLSGNKPFFVKDRDLREEERVALQQYFQKAERSP